MVQNNQESRRKYWATGLSVCLFARIAHSFACSTLLTSLMRSVALIHLLVQSLTSLWESERLNAGLFRTIVQCRFWDLYFLSQTRASSQDEECKGGYFQLFSTKLSSFTVINYFKQREFSQESIFNRGSTLFKRFF